MQLYSGNTHLPIRRDLGPQMFDAIGNQVVPFGDYDLDGVPDYLASNQVGGRGVVVCFSGATGQVLREWSDELGFSQKLIAGMDLDLDGVQDIFVGGPQPTEVVPGGYWFGRAGAFSGRDGGLLWDERNVPWNVEPGTIGTDDRSLGEGLANVGPIPGSPYPVVVVWIGR